MALLPGEDRPLLYIHLHNGFHSPEELLQLLQNHDPVCICLQQLILGSRFLPTPQGYVSFTSAIRGPHGQGIVGILLRRSVPGSEVPLCTPLHAVAVRIHLRQTYTVCSLYLAPGVPIARDDLVELLQQLPEPFFVIGDFNIRLPFWGDTAFSNFGFFSLLCEL